MIEYHHDPPKPGQFIVLLKQCVFDDCESWFIGSPSAKYCPEHKGAALKRLQENWRKAQQNGGFKGTYSRFSMEEIAEMREMFHKMPAKEIAEHFECSVALIYRYQHKDPENPRPTDRLYIGRHRFSKPQ